MALKANKLQIIYELIFSSVQYQWTVIKSEYVCAFHVSNVGQQPAFNSMATPVPHCHQHNWLTNLLQFTQKFVDSARGSGIKVVRCLHSANLHPHTKTRKYVAHIHTYIHTGVCAENVCWKYLLNGHICLYIYIYVYQHMYMRWWLWSEYEVMILSPTNTYTNSRPVQL